MIDEDAVAAVAKAFLVDGEFKSAVRYGSGHIHDTYSVRFDEGGRSGAHIILQHINTKIFKNPAAVMENIRRVTTHVRARMDGMQDADRRVLQLVPTRKGRAWLVDNEERYWRAYWFIEGAKTLDEVKSKRQAFEAAKAFGKFQRMLGDLSGERLTESIPHFHDTPKRFIDFEFAVDADARGRVKQVKDEIAFALKRRFIARTLVEAGLPERVTHNDTKLNNVMIDERTGEGICVIDLDTVMPGFAAYDFGDMVRTMTCPAAEDEQDIRRVEMRFELFEAVLRGYLTGTETFLTSEERESLIAGAKVIVFEQGVRFLADHLAGDAYYKVSREGQNLDRCRTQFKLLESIEKQEQAMLGLLRSIG